jgi:hypothetical protein
MKKKSRKPTGTIGAIQMGRNAAGENFASFDSQSLSKDKEVVEGSIVKAFFHAMSTLIAERPFLLSDPVQNEESSLDFTVTTPTGPADLELVEVVPERYEKASAMFKPYDLATFILGRIRGKSSHYGMKRDKYLLVYVTHWAFIPCDNTFKCVQYWCREAPPAFKEVYFFMPAQEGDGIVRWIYPVAAESLGNFNPESIKDCGAMNLDPTKWQVLEGGTGISQPIDFKDFGHG